MFFIFSVDQRFIMIFYLNCCSKKMQNSNVIHWEILLKTVDSANRYAINLCAWKLCETKTFILIYNKPPNDNRPVSIRDVTCSIGTPTHTHIYSICIIILKTWSDICFVYVCVCVFKICIFTYNPFGAEQRSEMRRENERNTFIRISETAIKTSYGGLGLPRSSYSVMPWPIINCSCW